VVAFVALQLVRHTKPAHALGEIIYATTNPLIFAGSGAFQGDGIDPGFAAEILL